MLAILLGGFASSVRAADPDVASPLASYIYLDTLADPPSQPNVVSPLVSYLYSDWVGDENLTFQNSPLVSFFYQFLDAPQLTIVPTFRVPTTAESTPAVLLPPPSSSQLKTFLGGVFTTDAPPLDPSRITIVLTHGWKSDPEEWAKNMAELINVTPTPNIVAWDWRDAARSHVPLLGDCQPGKVIGRTPAEGRGLGQALLEKLGVDYSQPIHFIGHSFGTLVNSYAANWLHGDRWALEDVSPAPWPNAPMHMTLFDEAEIATDENCRDLLQVATGDRDPFTPRTPFYHPLPKGFTWADNYISAFGLLHREAPVNVILTNGFPGNAPSFSSWKNSLIAFHGYPYGWYDETIQTDVASVGHRWSFERGGFSGAPTDKVFMQDNTGWNLVETGFADAENFLKDRIDKYRATLSYALTQRTPDTISANGTVSGEMLATGPLNAVYNIIISLLTRHGSSPAPQFGPRPLGAGEGGGSETNLPAYAWIPLFVPADAVAMSFDFKIQGDWQADSLAAALNGTNILLLLGAEVETNILFSSGPIDVSTGAGRTNEFFVGIVGGTSTNAQLTVQDIQFFSGTQPSLQVKASTTNLFLSWPLSAQDFNLQSSTNLTDTNAWTTLTNAPAIVDLQNAVTNPISAGARFYRLKK